MSILSSSTDFSLLCTTLYHTLIDDQLHDLVKRDLHRESALMVFKDVNYGFRRIGNL